jgi:hypothetical protein
MGDSAAELGIQIFIALCGLFVLAGALRVLYDQIKAKYSGRDSVTDSRISISRSAPPASVGPSPAGCAGGDATGPANRGGMNSGFEFGGPIGSVSEPRGGDGTGGEINDCNVGESGGDCGDLGGGGDYGGGGSGGGWG